MTQRTDILSLFNGGRPADVPTFSGLIHVTAAGLESAGLGWREVHHDAHKMARAAISTFRMTGMSSVTLPLDLTAPAEALGAELVFYDEADFQFPQVRKALAESARGFTTEQTESMEILEKKRMPLILEAMRLVKKDVGEEVVISGTIPGPYTLLLYLCDPTKLFIDMKKDPQPVSEALLRLASVLSRIGQAYREAGTDFITIHEMGGSPGFLGPKRFEQFVLPALQALTAHLPAPRVLSVCGNATASLSLLGQAGAEGISLDQTVDMSVAREALKDKLLFGNLDPMKTLKLGDPAGVSAAAARAREAGVDAVWPGCDLIPRTAIENIQAMSTT